MSLKTAIIIWIIISLLILNDFERLTNYFDIDDDDDVPDDTVIKN